MRAFKFARIRERWAHADRLGSVVKTTDSAGNQVDEYTYSPYGESGPEGDSGFPFRFTGQKLDPETGLYNYKARFYDPEVGRFLQTDPIGYADGMNMYAYVGNDPGNRRDPSGLKECIGSHIQQADSVDCSGGGGATCFGNCSAFFGSGGGSPFAGGGGGGGSSGSCTGGINNTVCTVTATRRKKIHLSLQPIFGRSAFGIGGEHAPQLAMANQFTASITVGQFTITATGLDPLCTRPPSSPRSLGSPRFGRCSAGAFPSTFGAAGEVVITDPNGNIVDSIIPRDGKRAHCQVLLSANIPLRSVAQCGQGDNTSIV